jgi:four helix bundle protein
MTGLKSHKDLVVWQKAMELAVITYDLSKGMPKTEQYGLTSQMLRAAVSIPANIAEGNSRGTRKDYARFVSIARGSAAELETHFDLVVRVKLLEREAVTRAILLNDEIGRMLNALRSKLSQDDSGFCEEDQDYLPSP